MSACSDYDVAVRVEAIADGAPADEACEFDRIDALVPVSRASWVGGVDDIDIRQWPLSMTLDYRKHLDARRRYGSRAPKWPTKRFNRLRLEEYQDPLDSQVVFVGGRVLFLISHVVLQNTSAREDKAGGLFHRIAVLDVITGQEQVIAEHVEGIQLGKPIVFKADTFKDRLVVLIASMKGVLQVTGEAGPDGMSYAEPIVIATHEEPVTDLHLAVSATQLHAAWLRGTLDTDLRTLVCSSTMNPTRRWSEVQVIASTVRAGSLSLCAVGQSVHLGWGDTRLGPADQMPRLAWAMVATSHDEGTTFTRPLLLGNASDPADAVSHLLTVPADDALVVYWARERDAPWSQSWRKGVLDPETQILRTVGEVDGDALLAAYRRQMTASLTERGATQAHAHAD